MKTERLVDDQDQLHVDPIHAASVVDDGCNDQLIFAVYLSNAIGTFPSSCLSLKSDPCWAAYLLLKLQRSWRSCCDGPSEVAKGLIQLGLHGFILKGDSGRRSKHVLLDPFCRAQCDDLDFLPSDLLVRLQLHRHNDSRHRHRTQLVG